VQARFYKKNN